MRELWASGYMTNYMRHISAGFLVEHLNIDWRHGQLWFHDTLVDADVAIQAMMWQVSQPLSPRRSNSSCCPAWRLFAIDHPPRVFFFCFFFFNHCPTHLAATCVLALLLCRMLSSKGSVKRL
jgi:hypothetical protein